MTRNRQTQKHFWYLFAAVTLTFLQGCVIVPVPQKVKVEHGEIITPKRAKKLDLSNLTRDEILSELGKPTWDLFNSRVLVYQGGLDKGGVFVGRRRPRRCWNCGLGYRIGPLYGLQSEWLMCWTFL